MWNNPQYHYIGDAVGQASPHEGIQIAGARFGGTVRTRLFACDRCGAAVPEGRGVDAHNTYHRNINEMLSRTGPLVWG